eukprot:scaffold6866_cov118-Isochrysis_galbana.AAC.3
MTLPLTSHPHPHPWTRRRWVRNVTKRAEIVEAEPPPPRPLYPHDIRASLGAAHAAKEPTSVLWRAGGWVHQKQAPSAAVAKQRAPRPFSSTGFGVEEPRPALEESVLPAERMVLAEVAESIDEELQCVPGCGPGIKLGLVSKL